MEHFYEITPTEATLIGFFYYNTNQAINPFVGEQKNGNYLLSDLCYELTKNREEIKKIDFTNKSKISKDQLDTKPKPI